MHHLALRTADVDRTARFYRSVFGLEPVRDERPRALWLALGDGSVLMIERKAPGEPGLPQGSFELFALAVSPERKEAIRELALASGFFDGETEHTVYLRDPDGRRTAASTFPL